MELVPSYLFQGRSELTDIKLLIWREWSQIDRVVVRVCVSRGALQVDELFTWLLHSRRLSISGEGGSCRRIDFIGRNVHHAYGWQSIELLGLVVVLGH